MLNSKRKNIQLKSCKNVEHDCFKFCPKSNRFIQAKSHFIKVLWCMNCNMPFLTAVSRIDIKIRINAYRSMYKIALCIYYTLTSIFLVCPLYWREFIVFICLSSVYFFLFTCYLLPFLNPFLYFSNGNTTTSTAHAISFTFSLHVYISFENAV